MRNLYPGTTEYLVVEVTSNVMLDAQTVEISFDNSTYHAAAWLGGVSSKRKAQLLINGTNYPPTGKQTVYVRINAGTEIPVINAGTVIVN